VPLPSWLSERHTTTKRPSAKAATSGSYWLLLVVVLTELVAAARQHRVPALSKRWAYTRSCRPGCWNTR
jgi:hypothetical protein